MTAPSKRSPDSEDEVSLLGLLNVVLRHRGLVLAVVLFCFALAVAVPLLLPRSYTARSSFMPQTRKASSSFSGLAAQFGLALPTSEGGQSPAFYADLLQSRAILGEVVTGPIEYRTEEGTTRGTLMNFYRSEGKTPALRRDAAIRDLADGVDATTVQKTGVVNLAVTTRQPALAVRINQRLLDLLNQYNLRTRQSQASEERRFTERRLAEVRQDLRSAEDRLQQFLQRNRDIRNSPELTFQADRLEREVTMQQQVFTTLAEAFEQAKIEEVRDTPVITMVQQPEVPARPDPRGLLGKGLGGLVLGLLLGAGLAVWRSYAANLHLLPSREAAEFAVLRQQAKRDLLQPWRPVAELFRRPRERRSDP